MLIQPRADHLKLLYECRHRHVMCQYWSVFDIYIFIEECQSRKKMRCVAPKRPPWSCHSGAWKKNSWKLLAISWFCPFKIPKDKNLHSFGFFICPAACTWLLHRSSGWLITGSTSIMSCSSLPKMNLPGLSHTTLVSDGRRFVIDLYISRRKAYRPLRSALELCEITQTFFLVWWLRTRMNNIE